MKFKAKTTDMKKIFYFFWGIFILLLLNVTGLQANHNPGKNSKVRETMACNDTVQVILNNQCSGIITPDQILEGNYEDYGIYDVNIIDASGNYNGNTLLASYAGTVLLVEVRDTVTSNRCWGHIEVVDKIGPSLNCSPIYSTCYSDQKPGVFLPSNYRFLFEPNQAIPDNDSLIYYFTVGNIPTAKMTDLNIRLAINHQNNIDLAVYLVSPGGKRVDLFSDLTCGNPGFDVMFDDEAVNTANDLTLECAPNFPDPCVKGTFKSLELLSGYDGFAPSGTWKLVVVDKTAGNTGFLTNVELLIKQSGGKLVFPLLAGSSAPLVSGVREYTVNTGLDACGPATLYYTDSLANQDCSTGLTSIIYRHWKAVDHSGNITVCTQPIYVLNTGLSFLTFPPNYDNIQNPALSCNPSNPSFYPSPAIAGYPDGELCSMVNYDYTDQLINTCSGSMKVLRHWKVTEMCSSKVCEHDQLILVQDKTGPVMTPPVNFSVNATINCSATINVILPAVTADCSDLTKITFEVGYQVLDESGNPLTTELLTTNLTKVNSTTYRLSNAAIGKYLFTYTATDDCGNKSTVTNKVTVEDKMAPVAICDQHTVVTISTNGIGRLAAFSVDDGSNDNCSDITYLIRRMATKCDTTDFKYKDTITFCCDDINTSQTVELKVTDALGYYNTCMVNVSIQEKLPPVIVCPNNISLSCSDNYKDLNITKKAIAYDNCSIDTIYYSDQVNINQCQTGSITRSWFAKDNNNHTTSCVQIITITDYTPFTASDVVWPVDRTFTTCSASYEPAVTGDVSFRNEDFCSMVSARYNDEVYNVVDGSCKKILRHWEVIDWCHFNESNPDASTFKHTQVILVQNYNAPKFTENCRPRTFCTYDNCQGQISYTKDATDDCTELTDLKWYYQVDLNNDGVWDKGPVFSNDASGVYPNGLHRVGWAVEDGCGNITKCEEIITVKDCKKPTPLCITDLTTVTMNTGGMASICAKDFNLGQNCTNCNTGSYDNCTPKSDLRFSFSETSLVNCKNFTCADILNGISTYVTLNVWVWDNEGNKDYCTVYLQLQDNASNSCADNTYAGSLVYGFVKDVKSNPIKNVELNLKSTELDFNSTSSQDGKYIIENVAPEYSYKLSPSMNTNYLVGVSTLDIVLIQKHLLNIKPFEHSYQYVAADVNRSSTVTASDISSIRKLILGITPDFGNNTKSWNFILNTDNILSNNTNILTQIQESKDISVNDYNTNIDWVGIKMGDVNNSQEYSTSGLQYHELKSSNISTQNQTLTNDQNVAVDFSVDNIQDISGGQFTLEFNNDNLVFQGIDLNESNINSNNIGMTKIDEGKISVSWVKPENASSGEKLFTINFKSKTSGKLSDNIRIANNGLNPELYSNDFDIKKLNLNFRNENNLIAGNKLFQNTPNPFINETSISFELANSQYISIEFIDMAGKVIKHIEGYYDAGVNTLNVDFNEEAKGVIYYRITGNDFTETMKMIRIR